MRLIILFAALRVCEAIQPKSTRGKEGVQILWFWAFLLALLLDSIDLYTQLTFW